MSPSAGRGCASLMTVTVLAAGRRALLLTSPAGRRAYALASAYTLASESAAPVVVA